MIQDGLHQRTGCKTEQSNFRLAQLSSHIRSPDNRATVQGRSLPSDELNSCRPDSQVIVVHPQVQQALRKGAAVVALESTIISHGMPYPQNLQTALEVEAVVRRGGGVPATIAILGGVPHVGLTDGQLEHIARKGPAVVKVSRRDLAAVIAQGKDGATTVSATMLIAARANISVFVTGGIGGVHRGGENSMDISADLTELSRTRMCVVCAGVKSVLDIPRTLEVLETLGVAVASFNSATFPAFFSRCSGCVAPSRVDTPSEAARLVRSMQQLQLDSSLLIGVPIPATSVSDGAQVEKATDEALIAASERDVVGARITPFLLSRIQQQTSGLSLALNIVLVKNNAAVGTAIAVELSKLHMSIKNENRDLPPKSEF